MDEYYTDNQPRLIHCENCGEDYAATYRACPFCHTGPDGKKVTSRSSGRSSREGNRVRTNTRGGGYGGPRSPLSIVGIVLAVALIIAAVVIVVVLAKSVFSGDKDEGKNPASNPSSGISSSVEEDNTGDSSAEPGSTPVAPDGVSLDQAELSLTPGATGTLIATIDPVNWIGQVIWSTSDANVATVDQSGVVSYVGDGTCTITASAVGVTASCTVTCGQPAEPSQPSEPAQSSVVVTAYGNTMDGDFTLRIQDGDIPFKAEGGDGANYTWSIADPSIAVVDPTTGVVTPLAEGKTTMSVTSGGETTTVVIRVKP